MTFFADGNHSKTFVICPRQKKIDFFFFYVKSVHQKNLLSTSVVKLRELRLFSTSFDTFRMF